MCVVLKYLVYVASFLCYKPVVIRVPVTTTITAVCGCSSAHKDGGVLG